jgi:hypothetical protein
MRSRTNSMILPTLYTADLKNRRAHNGHSPHNSINNPHPSPTTHQTAVNPVHSKQITSCDDATEDFRGPEVPL